MADLPISGLPAGAAGTGGPLPTVQGGTTVKITMTPAGAAVAEAASAAAQRTAMGLGTAATQNSTAFDAAGSAAAAQAAAQASSLQKASNLSDLASVPTALTNLGFTTLGSVGLQVLATASMVAGSLFYASATDMFGALGIGTAGQILTVVGGLPAWAAAATPSPLTTKGDLYGFSTVNARIPVGTNGQVLTADSAQTLGLKWATPTVGTVTSVDASGGTTGLTFSGGPITSSGTLTLAGTLAIANGGTGQSTLAAAGIVTGSGVAGQVSFWNGVTTQLGDTTFLWDNTNKQVTFSGTPVAASGSATVQLGSGGFAGGGAPQFAGSANGTVLGMNVSSTFAGNPIEVQAAGAISLFSVTCVSGAGTGLRIDNNIAGSGVFIQVRSTGSNENLSIDSKGTGTISLRPGGAARFALGANTQTWTAGVVTAAATTSWTYNVGADTTITLSTEKIDVLWNGANATKQWATGALGLNRDYVIAPRSYRFVGASVATQAVNFNVIGSPNASTNATITTSIGAVFGATNSAGALTANAITGTVTNSRSVEIYVQTGATRNIALRLPSAPQANASVANLAIGSGPFDGTTATFFVGSANGTQIGINAATGFTGNYEDYQLAGVSKFSIDSTGAVTAAGAVTSGSTFLGAVASAGAPTHSWTTDPDTGMFNVGANDLGFSVGGTLRVDISTTNITSTLPFLGPVGSASAVTYGFTGGSGFVNTGMYSGGGGVLDFATLGSLRLTIDTSRITSTLVIDGVDGTAGNPGFQFASANANGMFLAATNTVGFSAGGTEFLRGTTTKITIASGLDFQVGTAYVVGVQVPTGYIIIKDNTGTSYKVSVNL